ncbi:uncharacterized protein FFNC_15301 [Fusarium fujikuroi]|nr:uncharacterized protein FFNC_15301 [Fusarium fujikuroi]
MAIAHNVHVDVAVIGGGSSGIHAAINLKDAGTRSIRKVNRSRRSSLVRAHNTLPIGTKDATSQAFGLSQQAEMGGQIEACIDTIMLAPVLAFDNALCSNGLPLNPIQ